MIQAGCGRNWLEEWYKDAAEAQGLEMSKDAAREHMYGEPFSDWKKKHPSEATPEQMAAFKAAQENHSGSGFLDRLVA